MQPVPTAQLPDGRALYAAHQEVLSAGVAAQDPRLQPLMNLWSTATLLREYRGDGYLAALLVNDLKGLPALQLHCATGTSFTLPAARAMRGWSEDEWAEGFESLLSRGLITGEGGRVEITPAGRDLREKIERDTDSTVEVAWAGLDSEALAQADELAKPISRTLAHGGAFPASLFALS